MAERDWVYDDNHEFIRVAASATIIYGWCVQRDDGYNGYNCYFRFEGGLNSIAYLHIHFRHNGRRVNTVRYFTSAGVQGTNIYGTDNPQPLSELVRELRGYGGYPNHVTIFSNLVGVVRAQVDEDHCLPNGELP